MINYLKGSVAGIAKGSNRVMLTLEVNGIGYEVQIVPRLVGVLPIAGEAVQVFTHLQVKEDQMVLYGFASAAERDLFRHLTSVSGVGAQMAIALLDTLGLADLVQAIVAGNTRVLAKAPGVGNKTAERLSLELKKKLSEWRQQSGLAVPALVAGVSLELQEEVEVTLLALGYTGAEVMQALQALGSGGKLAENASADDWIREAIAWLTEQ